MMLDFEDIKAIADGLSVKDFARKKPFIFTVICLIVFLFFSGLIILLIQTSPEKKKNTPQVPDFFTADAPVLLPDAPDIEKDYFSTRNTKNEWTKDEIEKWFTYPSDEMMNELEKTNDMISDEILGATP